MKQRVVAAVMLIGCCLALGRISGAQTDAPDPVAQKPAPAGKEAKVPPVAKAGSPGIVQEAVWLRRLTKDLNLTPAQQARIRRLLIVEHEKMTALHEQTHEDILKALTPQQRQKAKEITLKNDATIKVNAPPAGNGPAN